VIKDWLARTLCHDLLAEVETLRAANRQLLTDNARLEDRVEAASEDRNRLWAAMQEALDGERTALHTQINHLVQRSGGGIPYPEAHTLPAATVPREQSTAPISRAMMPGEAVARQTAKFVEEYVANRPRG